jgi:hypothetical protein
LESVWSSVDGGKDAGDDGHSCGSAIQRRAWRNMNQFVMMSSVGVSTMGWYEAVPNLM